MRAKIEHYRNEWKISVMDEKGIEVFTLYVSSIGLLDEYGTKATDITELMKMTQVSSMTEYLVERIKELDKVGQE